MAPILKGAGFSSAMGSGLRGSQGAMGRLKTRSGKGPKTAATGLLPIRSGCSALYSKSPDAVCSIPKGSMYSLPRERKATCTPRKGNIPRIAAMATCSPPSAPPAMKTNKLARSAPFKIMSLVMPKKASYSPSKSSCRKAGHEYKEAFLPTSWADWNKILASDAAVASAAETMCNDEKASAPFGKGVFCSNSLTSMREDVSEDSERWKYGMEGSSSTASGR
mmetsp:Transcript_49538/g.124776  ORF Transcript_49538/g.124776 Transcript_49538/m.124776 type:complete len:221 (+) Transcript_49538:1429-2091(+)